MTRVKEKLKLKLKQKKPIPNCVDRVVNTQNVLHPLTPVVRIFASFNFVPHFKLHLNCARVCVWVYSVEN